MPDGNGFFPPTQYSPLWVLLGALLLIAVIGWLIFVLIFTRRRPIRSSTGDGFAQFAPPAPSLLVTYLLLIDQVERESVAGALETREAHQRLSLLVREFAANSRGIRAQYMTLEDLHATRLEPLAATVGELYPGAFSADATGSVSAAAERARRLVREWR